MKLFNTSHYYKAFKKQKYRVFVRDLLDQIALEFTVYERDNGSFEIDTKEHGIVDYYPKSNRLLIRKTNTWKSQGLKFIDNLNTIEK